MEHRPLLFRSHLVPSTEGTGEAKLLFPPQRLPRELHPRPVRLLRAPRNVLGAALPDPRVRAVPAETPALSAERSPKVKS